MYRLKFVMINLHKTLNCQASHLFQRYRTEAPNLQGHLTLTIVGIFHVLTGLPDSVSFIFLNLKCIP